MATPQSVVPPIFQNALDEFCKGLSQEELDKITLTSLVDLQICIKSIQDEHVNVRKSRDTTKLKAFLEAMEEYGKVIEVFLNASAVLCFVWVFMP
jgi:hypothetical protein